MCEIIKQSSLKGARIHERNKGKREEEKNQKERKELKPNQESQGLASSGQKHSADKEMEEQPLNGHSLFATEAGARGCLGTRAEPWKSKR